MAALTIDESATVNETGLSGSHSSGYDCHEIVKSSGLSSKKRFCCDHGHKCLKVLRASVACQTDSNESDFDFKMAEQFETQGQECATANVSYDQQTVAQDLCHSKDEDGSKPEGVLRLMIHNFRNMNDTVRGPAKLVSGVPWKIMVMPRQHVVAKKGTQKCLGFFLQCCPESYSDSWSCQAAAELRLISQKHGVPNFVRKTNHIYTAKENDWGYSCFMTWADILDESQGYMKEESVILEVFVKAESPKGILTYEAFCKKIQDYMRLSDMQCSRNLIDKALEVNQTALKFCKDKDEMMKEELEKQKTRLIERKLMQSIERIEKDSKVTDNAEGGTNLSNLRQALAGNLAAYKNAASKALSGNNGTSTVNTVAEQQTKETLPVQNDVISKSKKQGTKTDTSSESSPNAQPTNDEKRHKSSSKSSSDSSSRSEVKTIVDNLVSNLSNEQKDNLLSQNAYRDKITLHGVNDHPLNPQFPLRRRSTGGNGALELFDLDEPCCSDQSDEDEEDEDESDYEDMDEVCDGCLVERLDNMSGAATVPVEAQDMSCQTDVQFLSQQLPIQQQQLKVRMTGGAGAVAPPSSPQPALNKSDLIAKLSPPTLKNLKQKLLAEQQACAANKTSVTLGAETNEELLKLITAKDNKASLSTIKDTLERLLSHDSLDALGGVGNGTLDVNMPLPFDLDIPQLQQHLSNVNQTAASVTTCVKTDIIDISAPLISAALTTTTTTTAVATTTSGNAAVTNTLSSNTTAQQKNAAAVLQQQQQIVSSNNPAAHSVIKKTLQQQQQLMDVNQQMVQLKQVVEFKRQQQQQQQQQLYRELSAVAAAQEAAADREALANLIQQQQQQQVGEYLRQQQQQQQFVQTELTYVPRAPSPITEEDYSLLRHAKEIVENRAEEFNRYSQIIEKSEYDRLAETVKKVEKRMRDIEKQTISCRKQLADEHERNYREEQKLNKLNKQLKQQLDQANEKVEKLNAQLRERRAEIKKMEKKLKVEGQTSAENVELSSRLEQIERDLATARQKHSEEKQRLVEENQKLIEIKKSLQQELSCATNEIERLHGQLEDKTALLRKSEANYKQERHQTQVSLKDVSDRAKKAEINLLEFKLEIFAKTLLRSHDECKNHVCQLEDLLKKMMREQSPEDLKWMGTYVQDYQRVRDKIQDALQKMKIDFNQQIDLVKSGRPLASLPVLEMPKPIPYPATPKQFYTISHEPKHPIAPIGVHPTGASNAAGGAPSNMAAKNRSYSPGPVNSSMVNGSSPSARTAQQASSTTVAAQPQNISSQTNLGGGGQFKQQMNENQSSMNEISPNQYMQQQQQSSNPSANAVSNQQNLANAQQQQQKGPPSVQQQQQMSQPVQQSMRNDFTPWSDPLQGLTQSLFGNKPLVNMLDNFGTYPTSGASMPQGLVQQGQQSASLNKNAPSSPAVHVQQVPPPQLMSTIPPPPIVLPPNTATATGQWHPSAAAAAVAAGWTFGGPPPPSQQQQMYTAASRQLHSAPPQSMDQQQQSQNGPVGAQDDSMQSYGRSSRQQTERNSPLSSIDTSMDSQITSDKSKQIDAVVEQLRSVFPHLNSESIRDCVNEFRSMQYNRSLKGLSIEHLFYGVSNVIFARHKSQQNASGWSVPPPFSLGANPDGSSNGPASQYGAGPFEQQQQPLCTLCGCGMRGNDVYTLNCNHTFHNNRQQQQQQQFVQTELTYVPRAPSPITEEDYSLLRHAKEIVENRAEEFNRYSQIIEKSEYDRLAETVKKVEKRMRDIEKQTISCRKQLADEHERNYREEQKLNKLNKQLKQQLDQANEKVEKLNAQLRERRAEIKKMEKKLKVEGQTSAENVELSSRLEQIERDLATARQKHSEEKQRLVEENQKLIEIKKSLQQELSCATNEIERLHGQLEDKTALLRKSEANYKQERHQTQVSLKDVSDRAKKAEINLLEFKLEIFAKTLLRSHDECKNHVCQLEDLLKKMMREQSPEDLKWMGTYVQDYQRVRDKIQDALQKMKIDFNQQIDLVKSGRPLASLPVLEMPKPIPYPATPKQFYTISHEPKHPIAPIGVHPTGASNAAGGAPSNMAAKNRSYSPGPVNSSMVNGSSPSARTAQQASSTTVAAQPQNISSQTNLGGGGQFKQQMNENQSSMNEISPNQYMQQQQQSSNPSANAVSNQQNLANAQQQQQKGPPSVQQQQQMSQPVQQSMRNDFTPWSDPLQGLTQSLFGNKPLVNMLDNFGTYPTSGASMPQGLVQQGQQSASLNKNAPSSPAVHVQQVPPPQLMSTIPPPPIVLPPNTATATGQWHPSAAAAAVAAGWTFGGPPPPSQQQQMYTAASRQLHSAPPQSMDQQQQSQNGPVGAQDDSMQSYGRSSRQQTERNSPLSSIDTSMDSQITSDKSKQIDAVVEQLRSVFPHLNSESIRDCVNEFRSMQYNRSLKGLSIEHLFYGVSNVIFARHKSQQNASGWSVPPPFSLGANPDGSSNGPASQYGAGPFEQQQQPLCTLCGCGMRGNDVYTLNCNHTFHNNCINPWLLKKPSCPICCAYVVPPEEFPDLA